jgi:hypothetical protein
VPNICDVADIVPATSKTATAPASNAAAPNPPPVNAAPNKYVAVPKAPNDNPTPNAHLRPDTHHLYKF